MDSAISLFRSLVRLVEFGGLNHSAQPNDGPMKVLDGVMVGILEPVTLDTLHKEILAHESAFATSL